MTTTREDVYSRVTTRLIADLEQGVRPWQKPWSAGPAAGAVTRPRRANGLPYRGVNVLLLWGEAMAKGYTASQWMTYRQAAELGAQVRKGERGALVVYAGSLNRTETDDQGDAQERVIPFMKGYTVFNVEQIDGLPSTVTAQPAPALPPEIRIAAADQFFAATGAEIRHGGSRAYYAPLQDYIQMPPFPAFRDAESHAATLAHELTHWTSHPSRLDRRFPAGHRLGSDGYTFEELVAEIGSAFLCADLGLTPEVRPDHAAYLASWLKVLKADKRAVLSAAAHAQRAADHLLAMTAPAMAA